MVKLVRYREYSLGTNMPIYLLGRGNQTNNPLLNLQYYSIPVSNTTTNTNISTPIPVPIHSHKPQYGESKYTSSLHVGKMHKIISKN